MGLIYSRVQINESLLEKNNADIELDKLTRGHVVGTLPKGELKGIYYINYIQPLGAWEKIDYQVPKIDTTTVSPDRQSFIVGHTEIKITDTRGRLITEPTDLRDYDRVNMVEKRAKCIGYDLEHNETVNIDWNIKGHDFPPCGEFIFMIQEEDCTCEIKH